MRLWIKLNSDDLFRNDSDWKQLDDLVATYAASIRAQKQLLTELGPAKEDEHSDVRTKLTAENVRLRVEGAHALRQARQHFGSERFDRFLYTVLAPSKTMVSDGPDSAELLKTLRSAEELAQ
jgi:hypothetical protein